MKLNLGCGTKKLEGFVNVDALDGADLVHDLRQPLPYADESVSMIYAQHLIEHFDPWEWPGILADWVRVLKTEGLMILECPDLLKVCESVLFDRFGLRWPVWHTVLYGERGPGMAHRQGFTIERLRCDLADAGLEVTRSVPWHDDYPGHIEDPAWHYNIRVEAVKP